MRRPYALYLLLFFLPFLAFGGLYGGIAILLDPGDGLLTMDGLLTQLLHSPGFAFAGQHVVLREETK
jgi:hypothetical protein